MKKFNKFKKKLLALTAVCFLNLGCYKNNSFNDANISSIEKDEILLQKKILIKEMEKASVLLHHIGWPILKRNRSHCTKIDSYSFGLMFVVSTDIPKRDIEIYKELYNSSLNQTYLSGNNTLPVVVSVAPNSPGEKAGIMKGDVIYKINNNKTINFRNTLADIANKKELLELIVIRDNKIISKKVEGYTICNFNIQPLPSGSPNAYADGHKIFITLAAIKLANTKDELAFLIGHELAHNIYHFKNKDSNEAYNYAINYMDRPKIRNLSSIFVISNEKKEIFADIEGIKLAYKAGYKLKNVNDYWRRLSVFYPDLIKRSPYIYKGNAYRAAIISKTINELKSNE